MADAPLKRTTEASQKMAETPLERMVENNRPLPAGTDGVRDRKKPTDRFDLSFGGTQDPADHYNHAGPDRVVKFVRRDEYWGRFGASDRVEEVQNAVEGTQIVTRKRDGRPVIEDDTIAISIPRAVEEQYRAGEAAKYADWERKQSEQDWEGAYDPADLDTMRRNAEASRAMAHSSQLTGSQSPTHGMSYEQAMRTETPEQRANRAASLRRGGRTEARYDTQEQGAQLERMRDQAKGKKTFGMGAGFDSSGKLVR